MFRITITCEGLSTLQMECALPALLEEFEQRPWQQNMLCKIENDLLFIQAENDFDDDGKALLDEACDAVFACVEGDWQDLRFEVHSVEKIQPHQAT